MSRPVNPDAGDVTRAWIENYLQDLHTAMPGRIERYDAAKQVADVLPLVRHAVEQPDGSTVYEDLPAIPSVPVIMPRSGSFFVSLPLDVGDTVLLVFCESAIGHWRAGDGRPEYPGDLRRHHLSHAVALPGLFVRSKPIPESAAGSGALVLGHDGGAVIKIGSDGVVHLGDLNGAAEMARADLVANVLGVLKNAIDGAVPLANDGGAQFKTQLIAALATWPGNVGASKVKGT